MQRDPHNLEYAYWHATAMFCVITNSFTVSSIGAAPARCLGRFQVKWDTL
jgi:hypothetical protein